MQSERPESGGGDQLEQAERRPTPDVATTNAPAGSGESVSDRAAADGVPAGRARWPVFVALAATIVVADQLTKAWVVATLQPGESMTILGEYLRIVYTRNTGGLFGLFPGSAAPFALVSTVVIALIAWYHGQAGRSLYLSVTLGLLLGGAIGNFLDRLRQGFVIDFVDGGIGQFRWYTFNVADAAISTALVLMIALAIRPSLASIRERRRPGSRDA